MRSASRHVFARVAVALLGLGLIAVPSATASQALAAGCAWNLQVAPVPEGYHDFATTGGRNRFFVGEGQGPDGFRALLWDNSTGTVAVLRAPGHDHAIAMDVNNRGVVVADDFDTDRPFLWTRGRTVVLALPRGATSALVSAINDAGTIVGSAIINDERHGIVWSTRAPRTYQDLGTGDGWLHLHDVSESGTIVASTRSDEYGINIALKGTAAGGLSRIAGLDNTQDSAARSIAGAYIQGSGTKTGDVSESSIRWNEDTATIDPPEFTGFYINSTGLAAGATDGQFEGVITGQAAVWDGSTVTTLPNYRFEGFSNVSAVTENGTVVGLSQATDDSFDGGIPVTWTCS
jgi:uncharacterized membrane protein